MLRNTLFLMAALATASPLYAQAPDGKTQTMDHAMDAGSKMNIQMDMNMGGPTSTLTANILRHTTSGTDVEPDSTAPAMLMRMQIGRAHV